MQHSRACQRVSHNTLFWNSQAYSGTDSNETLTGFMEFRFQIVQQACGWHITRATILTGQLTWITKYNTFKSIIEIWATFPGCRSSTQPRHVDMFHWPWAALYYNNILSRQTIYLILSVKTNILRICCLKLVKMISLSTADIHPWWLLLILIYCQL